MELWIPPQASLQIMWFLRGSTWFQQCRSAGTCLFRLGQTLRNNVVPMWFHVVPTMMTWIPPQASLQIMWFLCGSTWFQQCGSAGTCLFRLGQTLRNDVVPMWFHVVPTMMTWIPPTASLQIMWFLCGSTWFQQCRSARLAATNETLLGWLWTLAGCWQRPNKRRTSNALPSTITSAP